MGVDPGDETRPTFVGVSSAKDGVAPTLNEALESAALKAMGHRLEGDDQPLVSSDRTAWFDISFVKVELGNQHPKTYKVGVTYSPPGS
jgi:hypothetical protein